jgi:hypothetical protein
VKNIVHIFADCAPIMRRLRADYASIMRRLRATGTLSLPVFPQYRRFTNSPKRPDLSRIILPLN